jgi:hypothetical protein
METKTCVTRFMHGWIPPIAATKTASPRWTIRMVQPTRNSRAPGAMRQKRDRKGKIHSSVMGLLKEDGLETWNQYFGTKLRDA